LKIQDCELNPEAIAMAPFIRNEPEEFWTRARDQASIPSSLFDLYRRANYLSFGTAPPFLADKDNILFSYFEMMIRSLAQSLIDAAQDREEFLESNKEAHYPGKHLDDPSWTKEKSEANAKRTSGAFRSLVMSLYGSLDALSEIIAIFSQGALKNLEVGRAQFSFIETWLKADFKQSGFITTPLDDYLIKLHESLSPMIHPPPPESEWLAYLRMLRNKGSHLGDASFRFWVLRGNDGNPYTFLPREWPYLWEKYMTTSDEGPPAPIPDLHLRTLIHQDICEYMQGALNKVSRVISEACILTAKAYTDFSSFGFNQAALDQLAENSKQCAFTNFV
jgi:hypothetical protein